MNNNPLIVYSPNFWEGTIGILAGKLAEKYQVPCLVFTKSSAKGIAKGSGRTYGNIHLNYLLDKASDLLVGYGGHAAAAGMSIKITNISILQHRLKSYLKTEAGDTESTSFYDMEISENDMPSLIQEIETYAPYEDVSVSAVECQDPKNAKNILWQKLCKRYEEMLPLSKNLTTELYPDWEHMTYPDVNSRCEDFARQNIANSYLTHLNAGQQMIPPHLLMPYVEESINYLQSEYGKNEYREKVQFLKKVFIDLNADDSIVRNIQPQFKTEEEPVINENTETDLEK